MVWVMTCKNYDGLIQWQVRGNEKGLEWLLTATLNSTLGRRDKRYMEKYGKNGHTPKRMYRK